MPVREGATRGDLAALIGIGLLLICGIVTVLGAALRMPSLASAGLVAMLATASLLGATLFVEARSGARLLSAAFAVAPVVAIGALLALWFGDLFLASALALATLALFGFVILARPLSRAPAR